MENDDGGQRDNRRKSLRQNKNVGVDVGGSVSPRWSARNRTTSPEEEATGRAKRLSKQPANGKFVRVLCCGYIETSLGFVYSSINLVFLFVFRERRVRRNCKAFAGEAFRDRSVSEREGKYVLYG